MVYRLWRLNFRPKRTVERGNERIDFAAGPSGSIRAANRRVPNGRRFTAAKAEKTGGCGEYVGWRTVGHKGDRFFGSDGTAGKEPDRHGYRFRYALRGMTLQRCIMTT
ncbi:Hypothetical protein CINCED_3A003166 [Cinara cedri]|uniref:Uncharacterized protein n=1 Tax=Cinara cedri TaxID=506608 RepID=A0A5E4NLH7_9HEMI|nr:Hypothetical protein CINCED_3A003166 [Cinara cedri]